MVAVGAKVGAMIRGEHEDGVVDQTALLEAGTKFTQHIIDGERHRQVVAIGLTVLLGIKSVPVGR